jgi:hypothetical protein
MAASVYRIALEDSHAAQRLVADRPARDIGREMGGQRGAGEDDAVAPVVEALAELLQPLGRVHRIADEGVIDPARCPDIADDGEPRMEADADAHRCQPLFGPTPVVGRQRLGDGERGAGRMQGVIGVGERRAPEGHHRIADVFVDGPMLGLDMPADQSEMAVQEIGQRPRRVTQGDAREADDVGEHHRHLALLRHQLAMGGFMQQLAHQSLGHIGFEPA